MNTRPTPIVTPVNRLQSLLGTPRRRLAALGVVLVLVLAVVLAVVLPGGGDRTTAEAPATTSPSSSSPEAAPTTEALAGPVFPTTVASATTDRVDVYDAPDADADPSRTLDAADELSGQLTFVVTKQQDDWLQVQLPVRPNGSTGWIRAQDASLSEHDFSIEVRLSDHRMLVYRGELTLLDTPIGVGTGDAPTPGGTYYLKELLQPPNPAGGYGPYAYGLSGFSDVFTSYSGGEGVIGIHGTNAPETVGTDVSDGCIRVTNEVVTQLVDEIGLPLGTPVTIVA